MSKELNSDPEVVAYIARTRGAIGYVSGDASTEGVKVLVVSDGHSAERRLLTRVEPEDPEALQQLQIGGTVRLAVTISRPFPVCGKVLSRRSTRKRNRKSHESRRHWRTNRR